MSSSAYRQLHRKYLAVKSRERYYANRDKIKAEERARYWSDRDKKLLYQREYCKTHQIENRQRSLIWRERHMQEHLAQQKRHREENKARINAQKREYYQKNKEAIKRKVLEYHYANPEVLLNSAAKRRALKRNTQVDLKGIRIWMQQMRSLPFVRCYWCGTKVKGRKIHFDHVIPLSRGGPHAIGNLCASCRDCNLSKHDRLLGEWVRGGQTFLSL